VAQHHTLLLHSVNTNADLSCWLLLLLLLLPLHVQVPPTTIPPSVVISIITSIIIIFIPILRLLLWQLCSRHHACTAWRWSWKLPRPTTQHSKRAICNQQDPYYHQHSTQASVCLQLLQRVCNHAGGVVDIVSICNVFEEHYGHGKECSAAASKAKVTNGEDDTHKPPGGVIPAGKCRELQQQQQQGLLKVVLAARIPCKQQALRLAKVLGFQAEHIPAVWLVGRSIHFASCRGSILNLLLHAAVHAVGIFVMFHLRLSLCAHALLGVAPVCHTCCN
jgi:hypothetical protein